MRANVLFILSLLDHCVLQEFSKVCQENLNITLQKQCFISQNRNKTVDLHPHTHKIYTEN